MFRIYTGQDNFREDEINTFCPFSIKISWTIQHLFFNFFNKGSQISKPTYAADLIVFLSAKDIASDDIHKNFNSV